MTAHGDVVIVGAGHGGAQVAISLRQLGFDGSIVMIGRDSEPPYERPPLSKDYLSRSKEFERLYIRPPQFWAEKNVELLLNSEVISVDPDRRHVTLSDGKSVSYGNLVWAAGGDPRRLSCEGDDLAGVHGVRDRRDVDRIMGELDAGASRVVVVGGGYIGLEAASVFTKLGCHVTVLEAMPRVLARVAGAALSTFFEAEHRSHGVDVRTDAQVTRLTGKDGRVSGVVLSDGEEISADMVVVGIGIVPCVAPLIEAGARGGNGVEVDSEGRTSLPNVFAIGDCAAHPNMFAGGAHIRLESVQNANDMGKTVALSITGSSEPYAAVPWFWSNQYDVKLQTIGLSAGHDISIVRGTPSSKSFSVVYMRNGRVIALDCVNAVKDYVQGKALIVGAHPVDPMMIGDPDVPLKSLASA